MSYPCGHPQTPENTRMNRKYAYCRECLNAKDRDRYYRNLFDNRERSRLAYYQRKIDAERAHNGV